MVRNYNKITNEVNFLIKKNIQEIPYDYCDMDSSCKSQELEPSPVIKKPKLPNIKLLSKSRIIHSAHLANSFNCSKLRNVVEIFFVRFGLCIDSNLLLP